MTESESQREPWFKAAFGAHYLDVYRHRDAADAEAAIELAQRALGLDANTTTLDFCCGAGRHLAQLTGRGIPAVGLDLSSDLLSEARKTSRDARIVCADMRDVPLRAESFDRVLSLFSSFGYFLHEQQNAAVLREIARVLKPGGRALIDIMNLEKIRAELVPHDVKQVGEAEVESWRSIVDGECPRVEKRVEVRCTGAETVDYTESVRLYPPAEFDVLARRCGLNVQERFGSFLGEPYSDDTERQIVVLERQPSVSSPDSDWPRHPASRYIVLEGIDGTGKSTLIHALAEHFRSLGYPVRKTVEPTSGKHGRKIRKMLGPEARELSGEEWLQLFEADRAEHMCEVVLPALSRGEVVLQDRSFYSTAAYQGAQGQDVPEILRRNRALAAEPDLVVIPDLEPPEALRRISERRRMETDAFERVDYLTKVRKNFLGLVQNEANLRILDASQGPERVAKDALDVIRAHWPED